MGVRSDVGLAIKAQAAETVDKFLVERGFTTLRNDCKETLDDNSGFLHTWSDIKWYVDEYPEIKALYEALATLEDDDYLLIVVTPEYPSEDNENGTWHDNPWNLHKYVSCTLEFDC